MLHTISYKKLIVAKVPHGGGGTTCIVSSRYMSVKLNSLFHGEIQVVYVTKVLKQGINIKTMCSNFIPEFRKHEIAFIASHVC